MKKKNKEFNVFYFLLSLIITLGTGILSAIITRNFMGTYANLKRPVFSPPKIVFPIVWTILYTLMGISLYKILKLKKNGKHVNKALTFFFIQLVLNFFWTIIFFRNRLIFIAFLELILLIIVIIFTIIEFYKKDKLAGLLLIPYLLWCIFAAILNFFIWFLNA